MNIINYKTNQTIVEARDDAGKPSFTALLSYGVPQCVILHKEGLNLVTTKRYSNTTNKHRNAYVRDMMPSQFTTIEATPAEIQEITGLETA